ncbi:MULTISPECIES: hypothetical protein [unclassified Paracoccus (in: a-proteobacteria)]|uniref:hypothetical protein n=1 Tax=unclassified Paracoccus (in: a-proteobacteria) TaxID=2688777 RepID=UPI001F253370|nr:MULTISPECIES: hypothetical protein [unclassified Paracoccus (in: a-proteobacteria)]
MILQAALVMAALAVAGYCHLLARRLRKLNDLETGLGGAIAVMAAEIARLEAALAAAQVGATTASDGLAREIEKARSERAYWALQQQFMPPLAPRRPVRRRRMKEAEDA